MAPRAQDSPPDPTWVHWAVHVFVLFLVWPYVFLSELAMSPLLRRLRRSAFGPVYDSRREGGRWIGRRVVSRHPRWIYEEREVDPTTVVSAKRFTLLETYEGYHQATEAPLLELRLNHGPKAVLLSEADGHALDDLIGELERRGVLDGRRRRQLTRISFTSTVVFGGLWLVVILIGYAVLHRTGRAPADAWRWRHRRGASARARGERR
jgi:hypothetical protein